MDHVALSTELPFPTSNGSHIFPQDDRDAISFVAERKPTQILDFRTDKLEKLESKACRLFPKLREKKKRDKPGTRRNSS